LVPNSSKTKLGGNRFNDTIENRHFDLVVGSLERFQAPDSTELKAFNESLFLVRKRFANWDSGPFRPHHNPLLLRMALDPIFRDTLLISGLNVIPPSIRGPVASLSPFTTNDALDDLFMNPEVLGQILSRLKRKKAIILQGPPGVGKTFVARRLAYALMGERDDNRVMMVQFHPSYGYEDFVQGYRPSINGGLERRDGVLHQFARLATNNPDRDWFFVIDEINRGNLAKIFGELLMLIEADKRGPDHAVPLTYSETVNERFHLPTNLHFIGTMNTADRSLAMVDYALRRRFAFVSLNPALDSPVFSDWLTEHGAPSSVISQIRSKIGKLNTEIENERDLGPGFRIGHSFFCPNENTTPDMAWYLDVIDGEIKPLLEEYFDSRERVERLVAELQSD
jgi:5-methylcytosine-specific restriction protein B